MFFTLTFLVDVGFFQVDTHVHAASSMSQKHLLRFIKTKLRNKGDDIVGLDRSGQNLTLSEVCWHTNYSLIIIIVTRRF